MELCKIFVRTKVISLNYLLTREYVLRAVAMSTLLTEFQHLKVTEFIKDGSLQSHGGNFNKK